MTSFWADVVFADEADRSVLSRAVQRGTLRRLATGIYSGAVAQPPEAVVRRHWREILVHELPGAVVSDRCARRGQPDHDGRLTVIHTRRRPLALPGLIIEPRTDRAPDLGTIELPDGVRTSTIARGLLDNMHGKGHRYLDHAEIEDWIGDLLLDHGEDRLNQVRDEARGLAQVTRRHSAFDRLDRTISAALTSGDAADVRTPTLRARARGEAYDQRRAARFENLAATLREVPPEPLTDLPEDDGRRRLLSFYEAYFSNFIEGTEFEIDDAAAIVFDGRIPLERPADAHDILGTYALVSDLDEMRRVPGDATDLIHLLKRRHALMLSGRPDVRPGAFKLRANRAGSTVFVEPDLVVGTLRVGHALGRGLVDPFARAVYAMFLITEVHPFADGNGRLARIHMNAELVAARQVRIIIPTVYRSNYLAALKAGTQTDSFDPLAAVLRFAHRYTARVDFSTRATAETELAATNAFRDPREAEDLGIRLVLP